jgi:hypothetical protein
MKFRREMTAWILCLGLGVAAAAPPARPEAAGRIPSQGKEEKAAHLVLGNLPFSYSYGETLRLARQNGKPIFAYFTYDG